MVTEAHMGAQHTHSYLNNFAPPVAAAVVVVNKTNKSKSFSCMPSSNCIRKKNGIALKTNKQLMKKKI